MIKKTTKKIDPILSSVDNNRILILAVVIAAIFVVVLLVALNTNSSRGIIDPEPRSYPLASGTTMGSEDAPVEIIEFSDFQCQFCRQFHQESLPLIIENYIETGKVHFVFRNYTILGPNSTRAAKGALCAAEQDSFWLYHDYLFVNQNEGDPTAFSNERLEALAGKAGLDVDRFRACMIDDRTHSQIEDDYRLAQNSGAESTPTFLINGNLIRGAQSYEVFEIAIEIALGNVN
jgi:protein-disulfide isomerase